MIRPMQPADVPKIAALEQLCFADPWSEASVESELHNPLSLWLVDEEDGVLAGYVGSQSVPPETDMMNFAVAPAFRARGIGRALLCTLQALLHKRGITSLSLEVRVSNAPARALL